MALIRFKRGTRAQLDAAAAMGQLHVGEPYLLTDEEIVALGTGTDTYVTLDTVPWANLTGTLTETEATEARSILRAQKQENGYENRTDSTLTFDNATRTLTVAPTGAGFIYYHDSVRYYRTTSATHQIPDTEGLHYVYFTGTSLVSTQLFSLEIISNFAFTAVVYWDATSKQAILFEDERHGVSMDSATHVYNHSTFGTRYQNGLGLTNIVADGSGDVAASIQFGVTGGIIWDEDIRHVIANGAPQPLASPAQIPVFYRTGAAGLWRRIAATTFPATTTGTGRIAVNTFAGGTWQLTEVTSGNFALMHYFATGDSVHPIIGLMGQAQYANLNAAQSGAQTEINTLEIGALETLSPEYIPIATVIFETRNGYTNALKSRIRSTATGAPYIDWRTSRSGAGSGGVSGASTSWGDILGDITNQNDLQLALAGKVNTTDHLFVQQLKLHTGLDARYAATTHYVTLDGDPPHDIHIDGGSAWPT